MLPLISRMTGDSLRNLARNLFTGFYERGISANQALRELQSQGLGYRRTDFLRDYAQGKGTYDVKTRVRFVTEGNIPSEGILSPQYHGVPDKYSFVFRARTIDPETGDKREQYFFMHRNDIQSRQTMEGEASSWFNSQATAYGFEAAEVDIVEGYINPVWQ